MNESRRNTQLPWPLVGKSNELKNQVTGIVMKCIVRGTISRFELNGVRTVEAGLLRALKRNDIPFHHWEEK